MKKSVSELHKLKPSEKKLVLQNAHKFASEKIKEIFGQYILPNIPSDIEVKLVGSGKLFYNDKGGLSFYASIESIVIMMDIILQSRSFSFTYDDSDLLCFDNIPKHHKQKAKAPIFIGDQSFCNSHELIKYCISIISDEYYIENNKIYLRRNQKIISAIKKLNNDDLNEILQDVSVNMDYKTALWRLRKFFEKEKRKERLIEILDSDISFNEGYEQKTTEKGRVNLLKINKMATSFFNFINSFEKDIAHSPKVNGKEATQLELEIFFDFGLSLARTVLLNESVDS